MSKEELTVLANVIRKQMREKMKIIRQLPEYKEYKRLKNAVEVIEENSTNEELRNSINQLSMGDPRQRFSSFNKRYLIVEQILKEEARAMTDLEIAQKMKEGGALDQKGKHRKVEFWRSYLRSNVFGREGIKEKYRQLGDGRWELIA